MLDAVPDRAEFLFERFVRPEHLRDGPVADGVRSDGESALANFPSERQEPVGTDPQNALVVAIAVIPRESRGASAQPAVGK